MRVRLSRIRQVTSFVLPLTLVFSGLTSVVASSAARADVTSGDVLARPDAVSARLAAQAAGHRVEITGDETESTTTWANPDGTFTTDQAGGPIRVRNADGTWSPLDLNLVPNGDGTYSTSATPAMVTVSGGGDTSLAGASEGGGRQFGVGWMSKLPIPTINGGTATYQLDPNTSLVVSTTALGFTVHLVLSAAPSTAPTFRVPISAKRLLASRSDDGSLVVSDTSSGKTAWRTRPFVMWDSQADGAGTPTNVHPVSFTVSKDSSGKQEIDLSPSMSFLTDPSTVYPVTIDPDFLTPTPIGDTYVYGNGSTGNTTPEWSDYQLPIGLYSPNTYVSYVDFDTSAFAGMHVLGASLHLTDNVACAGRGSTVNVDAYPTTAQPNSSTVYANAPGYNTSSTYRTGPTDVACGFGSTPMLDVTKMAQGWASGAIPNDGIALVMDSSTSTAQGGFCSMDPSSSSICNSASYEPTLSYNYKAYPGVPTGLSLLPSTPAGDGSFDVPSATPQLTATPVQSGGTSVRLNVAVDYDPAFYPDGYPGGSQLVFQGSSNVYEPPGPPVSVPVPSGKLLQGAHLEWKAQSDDGTDLSAWSDWQKFRVDLDRPPLPSVSCPTYPANTWTSGPSYDTCTLSDDTDSDVNSYYYGLDTPTPSTLATGSPNHASVMITGLTNGWHTLYVQAINTAGGISGTTQYSFGVGIGGLSSPTDQQSTQAGVVLSGDAQPISTAVTYKYRLGTNQTTWLVMPTADVTINTSGAQPTWPLSRVSGRFPDLTWNVAATADRSVTGYNGVVEVEGCYSHGSTQDGCSAVDDPVHHTTVGAPSILLNRSSFSGVRETEPFGPGQLAPGTGDFLVSATDAQLPAPFGGITLSRNLTTWMPATDTTGAAGVLGRSWRFEIPGPYAGEPQLTPSGDGFGGTVTLTDELGASYTYKTSNTTYPFTFIGLGDAADGSVITEPNGSTFILSETDGSTTTWSYVSGLGFLVSGVAAPGQASTTYAFDSFGRLTEVVAAPAAGVSGCATGSPGGPQPGCHVMDFTYSTSTTATATTFGNYTGRLQKVSMTEYDPSSSAMVTTTIAKYDYDLSGMLRDEWDPRITPLLKTSYAYDTNWRLTTLTQPGINPWTMHYDTSNRLAAVSQTDPANGTATQTVAYGIPLTGSIPLGLTAPVDLSAASTTTWGENTDLPFGTGTAIFPADHVPPFDGGTLGYAPTSTDLPYATLFYRDVNGRQVNTAQYGAGQWLVSTTQYDINGNVIWSLSPGNRAQALSPTSDTDPAVAALTDSAQRANALATTYSYTDDGESDGRGIDLTDSYGPTSPSVLDNGTVVDARTHTHFTYDEHAPSPALYHLVTTATTGASYNDGSGSPSDHDVRTTKMSYDPVVAGDGSGWALRKPTSSTQVMPGRTDIVQIARYAANGNPIESRMPKADAAGDDAYTTRTDYYVTGTDTAHPECGSHPEWAGLQCWTGPASQPVGQTVPTTEVTYNDLLEPKIITETSGTAVRTTTTSHDSAGRLLSVAINDTTPGVTQIPTVTYTYDATTGLPYKTMTSTQTDKTLYDALGRPVSYTVPTATSTANTTTGYDIDGRVTSIADSHGTTTYTYGGTDNLGHVEHRSLVTAENTGMGSNPSNFGAAYDADGNMISESYPASVVATSHFDNNDNLTNLTYLAGSTAIAQFSQAMNAFGEIRSQSSPESSQIYNYDADARLTQVADSGDGTCTTRVYSFDADTNRTGLNTYPANGSGACSTSTTPVTATWTHDAADRTTNSGYTYDQLGRTLTVPAADTSNSASSGLTLSYFANDMVHSQNDGTNTDTFSLDPSGRIFAATASSSGVTNTNIYGDRTDSPLWISTSGGQWSRNVTDIAGNLAAIQTDTTSGHATLQIVNPHGDVVATLSDPSAGPASMTAYYESTEFGAPRSGATPATSPYAWLGGHRRNSDGLGGLVLMGRRLYNPASGRFLQVDPVPGGSANRYDYANQDPINNYDLGGDKKKHKGKSKDDQGKESPVVTVIRVVIQFFSLKGLIDNSRHGNQRGSAVSGQINLFQIILGKLGEGLAGKIGVAVVGTFSVEVTVVATGIDYLGSWFGWSQPPSHPVTVKICTCDGYGGVSNAF